MKRPTRLAILVATAVVLAAVLAAATGARAIDVASAAKRGKAEAEAGARCLASLDATGAASRFGTAQRTFSEVQKMLGPDWLGPALGVVPPIGRQYDAAQALAATGLDGSSAGAQLATALLEQSTDGLAGGTSNGLGVLLATQDQTIDAALEALIDAADRAASLDEAGLVPPLAREVRSLKTALGSAAPQIDRLRALISLEQCLLSTKHRILVVSQDGAELRPTGGFAGSYGVVVAGPSGGTLEEYQDAYALPDPPGVVEPPPGASFTDDFGFRDANWWIDFPTSAHAMLGFWHDCGQPTVDGIVVIDTVAMEYLLEALGPIPVPRFSATFTSDNLLPLLLSYTQAEGADPQQRKSVLTALSTELERRVLHSSPGELATAAVALSKAADAKHVQMYFTNTEAQSAVIDLGWSGRIDPPEGTTDLLIISNAMNLGSKINMAMKKTIEYESALMPDGSAESTLTLGYANTGAYALPWREDFRNWLRVYRKPDTVLVPSNHGYDTVELDLPTAVRQFTVLRGGTHAETLTSRVPAAWRAQGVTHYRLFIVRQADLEDVPTTVTITPPAGWRVLTVDARLAASAKALRATSEGGRAHMAISLAGDTILDVRLAPAAFQVW